MSREECSKLLEYYKDIEIRLCLMIYSYVSLNKRTNLSKRNFNYKKLKPKHLKSLSRYIIP